MRGTPGDRVAGIHFVTPIKVALPPHETAETSHTQLNANRRDIRHGIDTVTSHKKRAWTVWPSHTYETAWTSTGT